MSEETKIPTIEEMKNEALKIADGIPNLREKHKFMTEIRGNIIELSIIIEMCFDNLLSATGKDLIINNEKRTLDLVTGIRNKKDIPKLKTKKEDMKKLIKETFSKLSEEDILKLSDAFNKFWAIRDIFAHVPINWQSENLEFIAERPYKHFFDLDANWKNVMVASIGFTNLFQWIIDIMLSYNRQILFKKEIYSQILFGKSQTEIEEEAKKLKGEKKEWV